VKGRGNAQTMPLIEGVGDELVYTALVAVPLVFIFRSSLRYFSLCFTFLFFSDGFFLTSLDPFSRLAFEVTE